MTRPPPPALLLLLLAWPGGDDAGGFGGFGPRAARAALEEMRQLARLVLSTKPDLGAQMVGPTNVAGTPLFVGPPALPLGAELLEPGLWRGSWAMKNDSQLEAFVRLRMVYIQDDAKFARFRETIDADLSQGAWGGGDGSYSKVWTEDARQMWEFMGDCEFGAALLSEVLPRVAPHVDGFGAPRRIAPVVQGRGADTYLSQDLLHGLLKLTLLLRSFRKFEPVPGQAAPPSAAEFAAHPLGLPLASWDIIEVGAGPGIHAATLVAALGARTYTVVDLPTQQLMQHKVLARSLGRRLVDRTFAFAPAARRAVLADWVLPSYDLFLSTFALSELALDVRTKYFFTFIIRSRRGFVVDNYQDLRGSGGPPLAGDTGDFTGLDLVRRLQQMAYHVSISTYQEVISQPLHPSRAVVITWASMGLERDVGMGDPDNLRAA